MTEVVRVVLWLEVSVVVRDVVADVVGVVMLQPVNTPDRYESIIWFRTPAVSAQRVSSCSRPWKQPTSCGLPVNSSIAALIAEAVCVHTEDGSWTTTARS